MPANENRIKTYKNKGRDVDVSIYQTDERINCLKNCHWLMCQILKKIFVVLKDFFTGTFIS